MDAGQDLLTSRECEVVELLLNGEATKGVARSLGITVNTVKMHTRHTYEKLDVHTRPELFVYFRSHPFPPRRNPGEPGGAMPPGP